MKINQYVKKSLSHQFIALMGTFIGIFVIGSIVLLLTLRSLIQSYTAENELLEKKERIAQEIETIYNRSFFDARGYLAYGNLTLKENALAQEEKIRKLEKQFAKIANRNEDRLFLNSIYEFTDYYFVDTLPRIFQLHEINDKEGVIQLGNKQATSRVNHFQEVLQSYAIKLDNDVENNFQKLLITQTYVQIVFVIFILLILLVLLRIIRLMLNRIGHPLTQFVKAANDMSEGKDTIIPTKMNIERMDEIGILSTAFQRMVEKVQEKEQDLLSHNEELKAQQDELRSQQRELEETLETLRENEIKLSNRNKLINNISNSLNKQEVLDSIVENTCKIIDADRGMIAMISDQIYAGFGISDKGMLQFFTHWDNGLNRRLQSKKKPICLKREMKPEENGFYSGTFYSYDLYIPILSSDNGVMALMVFSRYSAPFLHENMDEYEALAKSIGISLEKINLYEKSEDERKLNQDILNTVHEGIQLINKNKSIVQVNEQLNELFGLAKGDRQLVGLKWEEWTTLLRSQVEDDMNLFQFLENAISSEHTISQDEQSFIYRKKENNQVIKIYCEDLYHGDKKFGKVIVYRDITKEFEVDQMKSEFVSTVSHELRTPLASILGFTELMMNRDLKKDKQNKYLKTILNETKRLTALINDFLDVQRMESGKQTYEKKFFELVPILEKVIEMQKVNTENHKITLKCSVSDSPYILGDKMKIEQVFTNLISNAIKYSPDGGKVEICIDKNQKQIEVAVKDQGLGIPDDAFTHLFTKFYRVDNTDRRKIGGTGLGLAIVHEIMKAHGGDIRVESDLGEGSIFTVVFPVYEGKEEAFLEDERVGNIGRGYHIMVIEDDTSLAQLIIQELRESGFHAENFKNGRDALLAIEKETPDAIVLDILLEKGDLDGWEVMEMIKKSERFKDIPIIISSALEEKEKGLSLGANDYLIKPYKQSQLSKAIMQTLLNMGKMGQILVPDTNERNRFKPEE
ncbi:MULTISPECIES: ATP-binding protein [unclassified Bacillus (in: firmicutes)]|uniref:ATP-binding protein n=1 Tax=unclassified Bacillus (in: firmicutes) TaxID=185979 RepID=UPI0008E767FF|nr:MULTISPECIES: ATP-binding protein [unclassified Bacillus (in: firmicutes)]SFA81030.1 Signal transduction histidine kinase [Bacillus sp. UNCCL13]SFQ71171.1 Signal transduction histidine kinase [Bacillus sp. cl95]